MSIKYNPEFVQLISDLSQINKKIIIERNEEEEKIIVNRKNEEKYMAYILKAPYDYFNIDGTIGIYDYVDFFKHFNALTNPTLTVKSNKLVISDDSMNINYILASPDSLPTGAKNVNFDTPSYEFELTKEDIIKINSIQRLVKPRYATFKCTKDLITVKFLSLKDEQDTSVDQTFKPTVFDSAEDVEFNVYADVFEKIPTRDYKITIQCPGHLKFSLIDETIELDIYTGRTKQRKDE